MMFKLLKKLYPNYAKYVGNEPKYLKQHLRSYRDSKILNNISNSAGSNKIKKNLDIKLYREDIKKVNKKNKKLLEEHRNKTGRVLMNS